MCQFNYSKIKKQKWDPELLGLIASIYKEAGKQEVFIKGDTTKMVHSKKVVITPKKVAEMVGVRIFF